MLAVCFFWDEFKIHATDVYHRYIINDLTLAVEIVENNSEKDGLDAMKLAEVERKMIEFQEKVVSERAARKELEVKLAASTKRLEGLVSKETGIRKRQYNELDENVDEKVNEIETTLERNDDRADDIREELLRTLENRRQTLIPRNEKQTVKFWWKENTQLGEGPSAQLCTRKHIFPVFVRICLLACS